MDMKPGTTFGEFNPVYAVIFLAMIEIERWIPEWNLTYTAGSNGDHEPGSAHYRFQAVDIRTHNLPHWYDASWVVKLMQTRLGEKFLVQIEDEKGPNEHIHVQLRKGMTFTWSEIH